MNKQSEYNKNNNLASIDTKNKILNYLYQRAKLNIKHENIAGEKDLDQIRDNEYIICPRFSGTRSWILFFKSDEIYYAVNFPKHSQQKKKDIQIYPINISVTKDFYHGTIMEGIYFRIDDTRYLVIDEVYMLAGQNQLLKPKDSRLNELTQFITKNTMRNQNFNIFVAQFFQTDKKNLQELYEKIKSDTKIQEIIFYPKIYGRKIYSYTVLDSDLVENIIKYIRFIMQKTDKADVYNLLSSSSGNKIAIAYIPDMETSKRCKQWFKDNKSKKELNVKCQIDTEKNKWIPIELIEEDFENDELEDGSDESDDGSDDGSDEGSDVGSDDESDD